MSELHVFFKKTIGISEKNYETLEFLFEICCVFTESFLPLQESTTLKYQSNIKLYES